MKEYFSLIVRSDDSAALNKKLKEDAETLMAQGWVPLGGPSISHVVSATNSYSCLKYVAIQGFTK